MPTKKHSKPNKSKKMPTHEKMKIDRKIRKNKKKIRRQVRKMAKEGRLKKRDPNPLRQQLRIPNMYPHKQGLVDQMSRKKDKSAIHEKLKSKDFGSENKAMIERAIALEATTDAVQPGNHSYDKDIKYTNDLMQTPNNGSSIVTENNLEQEEAMGNDMNQYKWKNMKTQKTRHFNKLLSNIFSTADILLQVLDARDPEGCRSRELEKEFVSKYPQKKLVLIINKIDLVPLEICNKWKKVLSNEFPTVLFKANLQNQRTNLATNTIFSKSFETRKDIVNEMNKSSKAVGAEKLIELLKNYSRVEAGGKHKTAVTIGIIGMPNVGKSSIINSLLRRKAASVSSHPGHTRVLKQVDLDSKVSIIDSPGVIISAEDETTLLLRNVLKVEDVLDPVKAVDVIVKRVEKDDLLKLYRIQDFVTVSEFLQSVAKVKGKFKKKGVLDLELAARIIIQDWNSGKLGYYTHPPQIVQTLGPARVVNTGLEMEE